MFVFSRIFLGHGIVYAIIAGAALLGELGHPKERAFLGSMFNAFFGVGAVLGAGIVVQTRLIQSDWSWRLPSILQALPSMIQLIFAFTVPESPRVSTCQPNLNAILTSTLVASLQRPQRRSPQHSDQIPRRR